MVKLEIDYAQLKQVIRKLPVRQRAQLIEELDKDKDTLKERFRQMFARIDARVKRNPISQTDINAIVKDARRELYVRKNQVRR